MIAHRNSRGTQPLTQPLTQHTVIAHSTQDLTQYKAITQQSATHTAHGDSQSTQQLAQHRAYSN